jgi:anti-sigma factor RsiW
MTVDLRRDGGPQPDPALCLDDAAYVLGSLSPAERQAFEQHLAGCPRCQAAVARLAGLPGLLAGTSRADVQLGDVPVPDTLLPRLLVSVTAERRRRLVLSGLAGAAVAAAIAVVVALLVRPAPATPQALPPTTQASTTTPALPAAVQMTPLVSGPMDVSLQLTDKQWGTSVVIRCAYYGSHQAGVGYQLVAFDPSGKPQTLGWWTSIAGSATTVTTASSLHVKDIARLEVQLPDGQPLLRAEKPGG